MTAPRADPHDPWWDYAHGCATALTQGREPPAHPVHGLILEPGEWVRTHAPAVYSRLQRGPAADRGGRAPIMAYNQLFYVMGIFLLIASALMLLLKQPAPRAPDAEPVEA